MTIANPHSLRVDRYADLFNRSKDEGFSDNGAADMVSSIALFDVLYGGLPDNVVVLRPETRKDAA